MKHSKQFIQWLAGASLLFAALYIGIQASDSAEKPSDLSNRARNSKTSIMAARAASRDDGPVRHRAGSHRIPEAGKIRKSNPVSGGFVAPALNLSGDSRAPGTQGLPSTRTIDPKPDLWLEVTPQSPGWQMASGSRRCEVMAYQVTDPAREADWIVKISENEISQENPSPTHTSRGFRYGFTQEEEHFRMRWGWNAYNQVQKDLNAQ